MAVVDVLNCAGNKVSEASLSDYVFNIPVKKNILHDVVRSQLAAKREGTASSKSRSMIQGSTRKLYRQKGTGNSRAGSKKSPLRKGGGVIFGPSPKSYSIKLPKKVKKLALKMALSSKLQNDSLKIIDEFSLKTFKTKDFVSIMKTLNIFNLLIVSDKDNANLMLSSKNVPNVKVIQTNGLNVYDVLKYKNLILEQPSIENIDKRLGAK